MYGMWSRCVTSWRGWLLCAGRLLRYDMMSVGTVGVVGIFCRGRDPVNYMTRPLLCIVVAGEELMGNVLRVPL